MADLDLRPLESSPRKGHIGKIRFLVAKYHRDTASKMSTHTFTSHFILQNRSRNRKTLQSFS